MTHDAVDRWKQLSELYERADDMAPEDLPGWLDDLRSQGHPLLDPLRRMLLAREHVERDAFLATLPPLADAEPDAGPDAGLAGGDLVGPWRLQQPLGSGGMAEVWLAHRDDGAYQRRVALKLLHRHVAAQHRDTFMARFARERDILASLHHAHIAALLDAGVTGHGHPWLALEYVEGEPITAACDRRTSTLRERVQRFQQVLLAVQHAHANLIVHRDLKPANILLTSGGSVKLLDFGIAKLAVAEGAALPETELTRRDGRPLTLAYAAPEQLQGLPLTTACDVYSLGVVLYELLTGLRPYELKAETPAQLELAILDVDPRPPSRRDFTAAAAEARASTPAALRRQLAADLDAVVLRALAKQPAQRYGSVESLHADLQRWLDAEPVSARVPSAMYRARKFAARHRVGVALGGLAVAGLAGLAVTATLFALQAREESARAVASRDFMVDIFRRADPEKARGASITAGEMLDVGRREISERLRGQPALQLEMLGSIAEILSDMSDYARSDPARAEVTRLALQLGRSGEAATSELRRAIDLVQAGQHRRAEQALAEAQRLVGGASPTPALRFQLRWTEGVVDNVMGRHDAATGRFAEALDLAREAHGPNSREALMALRGYAAVASGRADHASSMALHDRIAGLLPTMRFLEPRERVGIAYDRLAAYYSAGKFATAWTLAARALSECVDELGRWDTTCRLIRRNRAMSALKLGQPELMSVSDLSDLRADAEERADEVEAMMALLTLLRAQAAGDRAAGDSGPLRAELERRLKDLQQRGMLSTDEALSVRHGLLESSMRQGQWSPALQEAGRLAADEALAPAWRARFGILQGVALTRTGRPAEAVEVLTRHLETMRLTLGADHATTNLAALNLAVLLDRLGARQEALTTLDRALPRLHQDLGPGAPPVQRATGLQKALRAGVPAMAANDSEEFFN